MIRQLNMVGSAPSGSSTVTSSNLMEMNNGNTAAKVAEVFLTAGHAFQKLGDLTLQLYSTPTDSDESKWSEKDVDRLRDALTRFAHELDNISVSVQSRITKLIKTDMKRRIVSGDDLRSSSPTTGVPPAKRAATVGQVMGAPSVTPKRSVSLLPGGAGISAVSSSTPGQLASTVQYNTLPGTSNVPGISRGITFTTSRTRYTPTTTPTVGATVTLQSTPQAMPGRTTKTVLVPAESGHLFASNTS